MKIIKYFFEFISVISLFTIFKIIGLKNASNLGSILGKFFGPLFRSKHIIKQNIKTGLGTIDEKKEAEIINDMWSNIGRTFAEYMFLKYFKFNKTNFNHIKINGINYLSEIKKNNEISVFNDSLWIIVFVNSNYRFNKFIANVIFVRFTYRFCNI